MRPRRATTPGRLLVLVAVIAAILLGHASTALAQQATPRVGYVYPAGGRQGTTFQVTLGGQYMDGVSDVYVSGTGVKAAVIEHIKPLSVAQALVLKDKLKELQDKKAAANGWPPSSPVTTRPSTRPATQPASRPTTGPTTRPVWTAADEKSLEEIRKKLMTFIPRNQVNPAIVENVIVEVTIAPDASVGQRDLRLRTPQGLTNPLVFCVGQLPEFSEPPAHIRREPKNGLGKPSEPDPDMTVTLPATLNGQIMPGASARFHFKARKGDRLVANVSARALIPFISDAVPGWFQAAITLYDAKGNEVAYADDYRFNPDPVVYYEVPADGEYVIEIKDTLYRGREDFVYRIALGQLPFITSIYPLGGKTDAQTSVEVKGWNLPATSLTFDAQGKPAGVYPITMQTNGGLLSNSVSFAVGNLPEVAEKKPNDTTATAQPVILPTIINGRISKPGDCAVFRFDGRAGQEIVAEVTARRLGSPMDSVIKLTDDAGKQIAFNDDFEDQAAGRNTHDADSYFRVTLPSDGAYYLHLGDAQHKGGPEYAYRLRLSRPMPDYVLRFVPSSISLRGGASVPVTVHAVRQDGFTGDIALALKGLPAGFSLAGATLPANQDQVKMTLKAPPTHFDEPLLLKIEGTATIQGKPVAHNAVPAEDMQQAFSYRHLVPANEALLAVSPRQIARNEVKVLTPTPLKITPGKNARLQVNLPAFLIAGKVQLELTDPPDGLSIESVSENRDGTEIVLHCDAAKPKPGLKGNLIIRAFTEVTPPAGAGKPQGTKRRVPLGVFPAIPFEIVE